jgi:hypothetical protein
VFAKADAEVLAERQRTAALVRQELTAVGIPTVSTDELCDGHGDATGVLIEVDEGDDTAGGVILSWMCHPHLTRRAIAAALEQRFDDPVRRQAGTVKDVMNAAVTQILISAGFSVVENPNDMCPGSLNVVAAPTEDEPQARNRAGGTASP